MFQEVDCPLRTFTSWFVTWRNNLTGGALPGHSPACEMSALSHGLGRIIGLDDGHNSELV